MANESTNQTGTQTSDQPRKRSANGRLRIEALGNLTADPELHKSQSGTSVLKARMAVDERVPKAGNNWVTETTFLSFVAFGNRADGLAKILRKGQGVLVEGRPQVRAFKRQNGEPGAVLEIVLRDLTITHFPQGRQVAVDEVPPPPDDDDAPVEETPEVA